MREFAVFSALALAFGGCAAGDDNALSVAAPDNPDTDIFVAAVDFSTGAPSLAALRNATGRKGYDNQPSFLAGQAAFYYVADGENGKTDIRLYDIARGASQPVTATAQESEYSPKEAPMGGISFIQENTAGDVTRVHRRAPGSEEGAAVVDFAPLGYYAWLENGAALGVYYRSEPGSLYRVDVASGETALLHGNIGRTLQSNAKGGALWFSQSPDDEEGPSRIARYDAASGKLTPLSDLPAGATDFFVVLDGNGEAYGFLAGSGAEIFWRGARDEDWTAIADLGPKGAGAVSRIALSDDRKWIAAVAEIHN
ncbi:MAG: hypothetical protein KDD85_03120 [Parvularculaceae bacterium]|nr:hypothetical protein [Parvularculaceae bacterium]